VPPVADGPPASSLKLRVLSAAVMVPPVLAAVYFGNPWFDLLIGLGAVILAMEWDRLLGGTAFPGLTGIFLIVAGTGAVAVFSLIGAMPALGLVLVAAVLLYLIGQVEASRRAGAERPAWLAAGALYIGIPCVALTWLRSDPEAGRNVIFWLFLVVWATDIGGYFFGRGLGGPKLAPAISPNKTWSGLLGGMLCAALIGLGTAWLLDKPSLWPLSALSAGLAVVEQGGDLLESWIKRRFSVKDMGQLIPGHGGLFDRVDGLLAVGTAAAAVAAVAGGEGFPWL
jgi:phosphatidate cytidylyltransferase